MYISNLVYCIWIVSALYLDQGQIQSRYNCRYNRYIVSHIGPGPTFVQNSGNFSFVLSPTVVVTFVKLLLQIFEWSIFDLAKS